MHNSVEFIYFIDCAYAGCNRGGFRRLLDSPVNNQHTAVLWGHSLTNPGMGEALQDAVKLTGLFEQVN